MELQVADVRALTAAVASLEPALLGGAEAAVLAEDLARAAKVCAAASARMAARAAECHAYRGRGFADPAEWLARAAGTTRAAAKASMVTAAALDGDLVAAVANGEVSLAQAEVIAKTVAERPDVEHELLGVAKRSSLGDLRDRARERRLEAMDRDALHARQRAARSGTHWTDDMGMLWAKIGLPPETGVAFLNRWDAETCRAWRAAHRSGEPVSREQAAADAFVSLLDGSPVKGRGHAEVVAVIDLPALRRGHTTTGERCHVIGGGPVPVAVVRELIDNDAFVKAVLVDGTDISTVRHFGRHIPAELKTALLLGPPPALDGARCPDCGRRWGLEVDHARPIAAGGDTSLANLRTPCRPCHGHKSGRERAAGLYDPAAWAEPDEPDEPP